MVIYVLTLNFGHFVFNKGTVFIKYTLIAYISTLWQNLRSLNRLFVLSEGMWNRHLKL